MTREIPLNKGMVALVDDADYERLSQFRCTAQKSGAVCYVARCEVYLRPDGRKASRTRQMQRDILYPGQPCSKGMKVIHAKRDPLDNRRSCNLRMVTNSVSNLNHGLSRLPKGNKSGFRGVYYDKTHGYYAAKASRGQMRINRGGFSSAEEAARAYNSLARFLNREHAVFNIIRGDGPQFLDDAIAAIHPHRGSSRASRMNTLSAT